MTLIYASLELLLLLSKLYPKTVHVSDAIGGIQPNIIFKAGALPLQLGQISTRSLLKLVLVAINISLNLY